MYEALRTAEFQYSKTGNGWLELTFKGAEFKKGQNEELWMITLNCYFILMSLEY